MMSDYLNSETPISTFNRIQRQTLASEESLVNIFSAGVEQEWYHVETKVKSHTLSKALPLAYQLVFEVSPMVKNYQR